MAPSAPPMAAPTPVLPLVCDPALWAPVYSKDRLTVLSPCERAVGTVIAVVVARDGDLTLHIKPESTRLLGSGNTYLNDPGCGPSGCLQVEIPCQAEIVQQDAIGTCNGFRGIKVVAPHVGDVIEAAGPWVADHRHHNWHELHGAIFRETGYVNGPSRH